jgi:hypothetical protein
MNDAPVPYTSSMEKGVEKIGSDLIDALFQLCTKKWQHVLSNIFNSILLRHNLLIMEDPLPSFSFILVGK